MSETAPTVIPGEIVDWKVTPTSTAPVEETPNIKDEEPTSEPEPKIQYLSTKERPIRPQVVAGFTTRYRYGEYGSVYVVLNYDIVTNAMIEIFITSSQTSARNQAYTNVLARMISNQIKHGVPLHTIYKHMIGMDEGQPTFVKFPGQTKSLLIKSIPDLVGNILRLFPTYDHLESVVYEEAGLNAIDDIEEDEMPMREIRDAAVSSDLDEEKLAEAVRSVRAKLEKEVESIRASRETVTETEPEEFDSGGCDFGNAKDCPDAVWKVEAGCETCLTCGYSKCG